jgi:ketosteroid isomerase-like protein
MSRKEMSLVAFVLCIGVIIGAVVAQSDSDNSAPQQISAVLDQLHDAAAKADGKRYFDLFTNDAVFIGTDATERWTIDDFKTYAMKYFEQGAGWTYIPQHANRHITVHGNIAWFDELLENEKYGVCRGVGVLRKVNGDWKVQQYALSFTVPNDVAGKVVAITKPVQK